MRLALSHVNTFIHHIGGDHKEVLDAYVAPSILVIDELGYLAYGPDAANCLFQVIDQRYLRGRSVVITSNKEPATWGGVLHDPDLAEAIVDRVMERGEVVRLRGRSYRNPDAAEAVAAPEGPTG